MEGEVKGVERAGRRGREASGVDRGGGEVKEQRRGSGEVGIEER